MTAKQMTQAIVALTALLQMQTFHPDDQKVIRRKIMELVEAIPFGRYIYKDVYVDDSLKNNP